MSEAGLWAGSPRGVWGGLRQGLCYETDAQYELRHKDKVRSYLGGGYNKRSV